MNIFCSCCNANLRLRVIYCLYVIKTAFNHPFYFLAGAVEQQTSLEVTYIFNSKTDNQKIIVIFCNRGSICKRDTFINGYCRFWMATCRYLQQLKSK